MKCIYVPKTFDAERMEDECYVHTQTYHTTQRICGGDDHDHQLQP